jgi:hypothetical protein
MPACKAGMYDRSSALISNSSIPNSRSPSWLALWTDL